MDGARWSAGVVVHGGGWKRGDGRGWLEVVGWKRVDDGVGFGG